MGVGVEIDRGEASMGTEATGVEREGIAGEGGGGIAFAMGVPRAGVCVGAIMGVEAGFAKALGFLCNSFSFAGDMRSLTMSVEDSGTLSSRASYLICRAVLSSW